MENAHIGVNELIILVLLFGATAWTLIWKGLALWHAARNGQTGWFVALLVLQTLGILEIIYLLAVRPKPAAGMPGAGLPGGAPR